MNRRIILIILFLLNLNALCVFGKSYKIVIDPGHSYKETESYNKIGPVFKLANGNSIYAFKTNVLENIKYTFAETKPNGWDFVYADKDKKNFVGFVEAALNLEVSQELERLLNEDSSRFSAKLTRYNHGYVMKGTNYDETADLKARGQVAIENNADLFLSIHFDAFSSTNLNKKPEPLYMLSN